MLFEQIQCRFRFIKRKSGQFQFVNLLHPYSWTPSSLNKYINNLDTIAKKNVQKDILFAGSFANNECTELQKQ